MDDRVADLWCYLCVVVSQMIRLANEREEARKEAERHLSQRQQILGAAFANQQADARRRQREEDEATKRAAIAAAKAAEAEAAAEAEERRRNELAVKADLQRQVQEKRRREAAAAAEDRRLAREMEEQAKQERERQRAEEAARVAAQKAYKEELKHQISQTRRTVKTPKDASPRTSGVVRGSSRDEKRRALQARELKLGLDQQIAAHNSAVAREREAARTYREDVGMPCG